MDRQTGLTLVELMIGVVLMALLFCGAFAVIPQMYAGQREADAYAQDVTELSRAMEQLEADLAWGRTVQHVQPARWQINGLDGQVEYALQSGELIRLVAGRAETLASCVAALQLSVSQGVCEICVALRPRRRPAAPAQVFAAVRLGGG